jgi:hypothetical protein
VAAGDTLAPIGDFDTFSATRDSWHRLAEHVLAPARYRATGRIGLRAAPGGFGTPPYTNADGDEEQVRVEGIALLVVRNEEPRSVPITTVAEAARTVGVEPGAPAGLYTPNTPLQPDAPLTVDEAAAERLGAWYELADAVLERLRGEAPDDDGASIVQLWPEHFDLAVDLGPEDRGGRGTFGASPGDAAHPEPYLYVTHWSAAAAADPYWSDPAFGGASLPYRDLVGSTDPLSVALDFYRRGRDALTRGESEG